LKIDFFFTGKEAAFFMVGVKWAGNSAGRKSPFSANFFWRNTGKDLQRA
jgi:hypothetical protein